VQRSIAGPRHEIFSIADHAPAHVARKTRPFGDSLKRKSRLFYLPPNAADRNPGELARKHLKAATAGRMAVTGKVGFQRKVRSSLRQLQNDPWKIISFFFRSPRSNTPPEGSHIYALDRDDIRFVHILHG
jgi:hypothetical protein